jgi:uncharacterized membrane-anchored protein YitT (DUF2179 family)
MGLEMILAPNGLVDDGVTALSIMANAMWGLPIFALFLGLNIPILLFTAKEVGKTYVIRTLYANIITSFGLVLFESMPVITQSDVLIVIYGGVILGVGVGIVVKSGGTIDGLEMLAIWFNQHHRIRQKLQHIKNNVLNKFICGQGEDAHPGFLIYLTQK